MSAARLGYAMGRDETLPIRVFGRSNRRTKVPVMDVVFIAIPACSALLFDFDGGISQELQRPIVAFEGSIPR